MLIPNYLKYSSNLVVMTYIDMGHENAGIIYPMCSPAD